MQWIPLIAAGLVGLTIVSGVVLVLALRNRPAPRRNLLEATAAELELEFKENAISGHVGRCPVRVSFEGEGKARALTVRVDLPRPLGVGLLMRRGASHADPAPSAPTPLEVGIEAPEGWDIRAQNHVEAAELLTPRVRQALGALTTSPSTSVTVDDNGCLLRTTRWTHDPHWLKHRVLSAVRVAGVLDSETAKVALADTMDVLSDTHPSVDGA